VLAFAVFALTSADVSHLANQGGYSQGVGSSSYGSSDVGVGDARFHGSAGGSVGFGGVGSSFGGGSGSSFGGGGGAATLEHGQSGYLDYSSGSAGGGVARFVKPVIRHGEPVVSKSFFVHEAPEEGATRGLEVEEKEHIVHPRKHYNIIFVKTPLAGGSSVRSNNVNVFPENEEKTIVYVLTGRNDGIDVDSNGEIQLPQPKTPSKPEVVFVKYNNEADAQRAISDIQGVINYYSFTEKSSILFSFLIRQIIYPARISSRIEY
jgi:hypothetical protein